MPAMLFVSLAANGAWSRLAYAVDWPRADGVLPPLSMRVHAVFVSDDDDNRKTAITPAQVKAWADEANDVFTSAGIRLDFDPGPASADWQHLKSTLINSMSGVDHPQWTSQKAAANSIAAAAPAKVVTFFRWGPDAGPTGGGFSWTDYNFIAMPGFNNTFVCGVQNIGLFAHEVGHYLGLAHTFGPTFSTVAQARSHFVTNGRNPAMFDGDGRSDTAPDPFIAALQCNQRATSVSLDGTVLPLPRSNIMSYYEPRSDVSSSQAWTMRQTLAIRSGQSLTQTIPGESISLFEPENTRRLITRGFAQQQTMSPFLGKWSNNAQLLWLDAAIGSELKFNFIAPSAGLYRIQAGFTAAPDYGMHRHIINGQAGSTIDLYSRGVLPTGAVDLGLFNLVSGSNEWKTIVTGSKSLASPVRYGYGLDYILLVPVAEPALRNLAWAALMVLAAFAKRPSSANRRGIGSLRSPQRSH